VKPATDAHAGGHGEGGNWEMKRELTDFEREVKHLRMFGMSYQKIADKLACTMQAVDNALTRIAYKSYGVRPGARGKRAMR
jgi:DNA-binding CsgD family transcriptional regulator